MTRVLVIGGAGVFGRRLVEGLIVDGFEVVVAGRTLKRASDLAAQLSGRWPDSQVSALQLDTRTVTAEMLAKSGATIVVDAAGPFQGATPVVARACIAAGLHYVDLADARDFVAGFSTLDEAARTAGVVALTGCSSTPALSNAVLDELTRGWMEVVSLEAAISPGARAPRGRSVMQATFFWLGRPIKVFLNAGWTQRSGWSGLHRRSFAGVGKRWTSLCETPDLDIFVERFKPRRSARFLAGLQPGAVHLAAWLLARLTQILRVDLRRWTGALVRLGRPFAVLGDDRGAMRVSAYGSDAQGKAVRAAWVLVAAPGVGPVTPSLPALAAVKAIANGEVASGARACVGIVTLDRMEFEIARHPIRTLRVIERGSVFARAIGDPFDQLPLPIRTLHETPGVSLWRGKAEVSGADGPLAGLIAALFGFPRRSQTCEASVRIDADGDRSVWRRSMGDQAFSSVLSNPRPGGGVSERFGPFSFDLALRVVDDRLVYGVDGWRLGRLPLPAWLAPRTSTFETVDASGRFVFDVEISLPWGARLVHYRGWLQQQA